MNGPPPLRAPGPPVIEATQLARWYGPVVGLTDLTVSIRPGVTGLLGPNGAGKSTFIRLLTGQILPSSGTFHLLGHDPVRQPAVFRRVGFCSEDDALFDDMSGRQMVRFLARCAGYGRAEAAERAEAALERTGIAHAAGRRTGTYSKGMRQRTRLAAAILHDPEILLLDEPMTGLDPIGRRDVVDLIRSLAEEGRSVLFSSHILHEVEAVASHVVILNRGMVLAEGTLEHIQECLSDYAFTLKVACDRPRDLAALLCRKDHVVDLRFAGSHEVVVSSNSARSLLTELPPMVLDAGMEIHALETSGEDLAALFERLVR